MRVPAAPLTKVFCAVLATAGGARAAAQILPPVNVEASAADVRSTAAGLIPSSANATSALDLTKLYRLQIAAGRLTDADATVERLEALYRSTEPGRAGGLVPWRIYIRAKRYEATGVAAPTALRQAFDDVYTRLSDRQIADVLPWYSTDLDELRATYAAAVKVCDGSTLATCPSADKVIAAKQALVAWSYLEPVSKPLIRADAERRFIIDDRRLIPTPDGAEIAAIIVRPRDAGPAKRVSLLNFTIYANDDWSFPDAVKMASYGYAGVVAYTRGKGRSPGPVVPYLHDGADAATVIGWLAAQPWSDGRVGMFSGSYNAFTQWAAAKHQPPALKAIATNASNAPGIDTPMQGNVFQSFIYPWPFYTTDTKGLDDKTYDDAARWKKLERTWYASGRPYRDLDRIDGTPNPVFDAWLDHPSYDAYWRRLIPYGAEFAKIDIPVFVETGYYDGGMVGALYYLQQHDRYCPSADERLLIGPYHHTAMQTGVLPVVDGYAIDPAARIDLQDIRLKWFDHVFHGAPLPEILSGRINFEVMGANRWRHVASLAQMGDRRLRLYLTGARRGDHWLFSQAPPAAAAVEPELSVDFADRRDVDYQPPTNGLDTRNALVFATAPLPRAMEVDGLFHGRFAIVTNKRDFDLSVEMFEQKPDGTVLPLASYLGRASYMADRCNRTLLSPGSLQTLAFQSQTVTARRLDAGGRIVAVVGVPKRPDTQINYGTGRNVSDENIADAGVPLHIRWKDGSYIDLSVRQDDIEPVGGEASSF